MKVGKLENLNVEPLRKPISQSVTVSGTGTTATLSTANPNIRVGDILEIEEGSNNIIYIGKDGSNTLLFFNTGSPTSFTDKILRFSQHQDQTPNLDGSILKLDGALTAVSPTYTGTSNPTAYTHFYTTTNNKGLERYLRKIISIAPATTVNLSAANGFRQAVAKLVYRAKVTDISATLTVLSLSACDSSLPIPDAVYAAYTLAKRHVVKGNVELETVSSVGLDFTVDSTTTGSVSALDPVLSAHIKLTNGSLAEILGIKSPITKSQQLTLTNATGNTIPIREQNLGASAVDRIVTGSGADFDLEDQATITFIYDPDSLRWRLSSGGGAGGMTGDQHVIVQNETLITEDYTIQTTYNGLSVGPVTIDTGITVTIPVGSKWVIL